MIAKIHNRELNIVSLVFMMVIFRDYFILFGVGNF